ncbi:hypothetical protein Tdes44962_MAKER04629 [Teratosphaeria destructans]|uniref:Uncharacterized protein n=1 Tax=Teratosphaeria destructans TaxID=418781 RepID=A0A9W7SLN7_9PEZI|nr:hypothetical protein Tdes44962_MAKER04629 [Teratosphaeria destructans]
MSSPQRPGAPGFLERFYIIDDSAAMADTDGTQAGPVTNDAQAKPATNNTRAKSATKKTQAKSAIKKTQTKSADNTTQAMSSTTNPQPTPRRSQRNRVATKPFEDQHKNDRQSAKRVSQELSNSDPPSPTPDRKIKKPVSKRNTNRAATPAATPAATSTGNNLASGFADDEDDAAPVDISTSEAAPTKKVKPSALETTATGNTDADTRLQFPKKRKSSALMAEDNDDDDPTRTVRFFKKRKALPGNPGDSGGQKPGSEDYAIPGSVYDPPVYKPGKGPNALTSSEPADDDEPSDDDIFVPFTGKKRTYDEADIAAAKDLLALSANNTAHLHSTTKKRKTTHETPVEAAEGVAALAAAAPAAKASRKTTRKPKTVTATNNDNANDNADASNAANNDAVEEGLKACEGHATGKGTTSIKPANAVLDEPWACANRHCSTGMTYLLRDEIPGDSNKGYGRKTISDYLGRNKKETNSLASASGAPKPPSPSSSSRACSTAATNTNPSCARTTTTPTPPWPSTPPRARRATTRARPTRRASCASSKTKRPSPSSTSDDFIAQVCGPGKDYSGVEAALCAIEDWYFVDKTITQMPPVEFLIGKMGDDEIEVDPEANYQAWLDELDQETQAANILMEAATTPVVMSIEGPAVPLPLWQPPKPVVKKADGAVTAQGPVTTAEGSVTAAEGSVTGDDAVTTE